MWDLALKINFPWNIRNNMSILKLMNHDISIVGVTPYFSTGQILLKKNWHKINIDTNNTEKLFKRIADHK